MIVLNEAKVKYEALDQIIGEYDLDDVRFTKNVNIIVDMKEIFKKIFRPNVFPKDGQISSMEIFSDIVGIIGHYRNYFYKKGKYTSFYFLYSNQECKLKQSEFADYKKEHYDKYYKDEVISELKNKILKAFNKFLDFFVPNAFYIDCSEYDDVAVVKFLKNEIRENEYTLLLTNDELWFQALKDKNIRAINCKGIKSSLIRAHNALSYLSGENNCPSSNLLPFVYSICGCSKYSIPNIRGIGIKRAIAIVEELVANKKLLDTEYLNFPIKIEDLNPNNKSEKILIDNFETLKTNYELISCTNVIYSHENEIRLLFNKPKKFRTLQSLMEFNNTVMYKYPINLDMLLKGETLQ